jgi:hypothetical protein
MNSSNLARRFASIGALLVVCVFVLGGCGGGSDGGGGGGTPAAVAVEIGGSGSNPQDVINKSTEDAVDVEVTLPASSKSTDTVTVTLSDGNAATEASAQGQGNGVDGGGVIHVVVDASGLEDGPVDVLVQVGSLQSNFPGALMKDTVGPELPTSVEVLDAQGAGIQYFNIVTTPASTVRATFANAGSGQDTAQVVVRDGVTQVPSIVKTWVWPASSVSFPGLDVSALADGPVDVDLVLTDANMNTTTSTYQLAKDTVAPAGAVAAQIPNGPSSPSDTINLSTVASVTTLVAVSADVENRTVRATFSDGVTTVTSPSDVVPPAGGLQFTTGAAASSLSDGAITVTAIVSDDAGNEVTFVGTPATKDTVAPSAPTAASVSGGGSNPPAVINLASAFSVAVGMTWPASSSSSETATVTIGSATSLPFNAPNGGGSSSVTGVDCSGVSDGTVAVSVSVSDAAGNVSTFSGTAALKDTIPPAAPSVARVAAGVQNAIDVVNIASAAAVQGTAFFPASSQGNETFQMSLSDGSTMVTSVATNVAAGGGATAVGPMNSSSLSDGPLTVTISVMDPAQNVASMTGTSAMKDTIAPTAPTAASVSSGSGNGANVINNSNVNAVDASVTWPAGAPGNETAQLVFTNGGTVSAPVAQSSGAGVVPVSGINAGSLADGSVTVSVVTTDAAGNSVTFMGTPATKNTVGPAGPLAAMVPGSGSNPANWVNANTVTSATVHVTFAAGAAPTDVVSLSCSDGSTTIAAGSQAVPPAGGTVVFSGVNMSSLQDGSVMLIATVTDASSNTAVLNAPGTTKDVVLPNPTAANVPAGVSNPADFINTAIVLSSSVSVAWPGDAGGESMYVVLSDGVSSTASVPQTLASGAASVTFASLDASPLVDGPITVTVHVSDTAGNQTTYAGTPATKDTLPPVAPSSAHVDATVSSAIDVINQSSVAAVAVSVGFAAGANAADFATVTLSDGTNGVSSPSQSVVPNGTVTWSGIAAGSLADGTISLSVNLADAAGNVTTFGGTPATKDVVPPATATSIAIPASVNNALGFISLATQGAVAVDATIAAVGAGVTTWCQISDGPTTLSYATVAAPGAGGVVNFTGLDCSSLVDGGVTVTVYLADAAGNTVSSGSTGSKDVVPPATPVVDPTTSPTASDGQVITGQCDPGTSVTVTGSLAPVTGAASATGQFAVSVKVAIGATSNLVVTSRDAAGNPAGQTVDFATNPLTIVQNPAAPPVTFTDVSAASGLNDAGAVGGGCFQDLDNDGDLDLFVGGTNKLWINGGTGAFSDVTATAGVTFAGGTSASCSDYDNDGDLDLVLVDGANVSLLQNQWVPLGMHTFVDVTVPSGAGATGTLMGGLWGDLDGDGRTDLVVTGNGPVARMNSATATFSPSTPFAAAYTTMQFGLAADVVADGRCDLVFGDTTPGFFWRNDGAMTFTDIAGAASNVSLSQAQPAGILAVDCDNDGDLDLVVASGGAGGTNQLYLNGGTSSFTSQVGGQNCALLAGFEAAAEWTDVCSGDVDHDGRIDLMAANRDGLRLWLNDGDQDADGVPSWVEVASACGLSAPGRGKLAHMADLDGDGDLDVFCGLDGVANVVYRNDINNRRNLTVLVRGLGTGPGSASKDAIGAKVELLDVTGTTVLASREISGGRGMGSQDAHRAHFGVTPSQLYTVRVTFTSGAVRTANNVIPRDVPGQTILVLE